MYRDQTIEKPHAKKNPVLATRQPRKLRVDDGCVESEAHIPYSRFPLYHGAGKLRCQTFYSCRVVVLAWLGTSKFESIDRVSVPKNLRVPKIQWLRRWKPLETCTWPYRAALTKLPLGEKLKW